MKKGKLRMIVCIALFAVLTGSCGKDDNGNNGKNAEPTKSFDVSVYDVAFDFRDKDSFDKTTALLVEDRHIYVSEYLWQMYTGLNAYRSLIETADLDDAQKLTAKDEFIKNSIRKTVYYDHFYHTKCSGIKPSKTEEEFEKEYEEMIQSVPKEDVAEFAFTKEGYVSLAKKFDVVTQYEKMIKQDLDIDIDKFIADNPATEFKPNVKIEILSVKYARVDDDKEEVLSNEEIDKLFSGIKEIAAQIEKDDPESLERYADKSKGIDFEVLKYDEDASNEDDPANPLTTLKVFHDIVKKELDGKEPGYISGVLETPLGACIVKKLEPELEADYMDFIASQVPVLKDKAYDEIVEKELENIKVQINDKVFEQLDPDEM